jgi:cold shock CspA family protein
VTGIVDRYDKALCYGFLRGDDGRRYFVHRTDVAGPMLTAGERVQFDPLTTAKGLRARAVQRLEPGA